jgi:hypothetical protein
LAFLQPGQACASDDTSPLALSIAKVIITIRISFFITAISDINNLHSITTNTSTEMSFFDLQDSELKMRPGEIISANGTTFHRSQHL